MAFIIQLAGESLEKARRGANLVPEKRTVTRGGSTFQMTVWVDPKDKTNGSNSGSQGSLFDMEDMGTGKVANKPVKHGDKITIDGEHYTVNVKHGFIDLVDGKGTVEWGTQAGEELPTAAQIAESVKKGSGKNVFEDTDKPAASAGLNQTDKVSRIVSYTLASRKIDLTPEEVTAYIRANGIKDGTVKEMADAIERKLKKDLTNLINRAKENNQNLSPEKLDTEIKRLETDKKKYETAGRKGTIGHQDTLAGLGGLKGIRGVMENNGSKNESTTQIKKSLPKLIIKWFQGQ